MSWKAALNAFAVTFGDRFTAAKHVLTPDAGDTVARQASGRDGTGQFLMSLDRRSVWL
jgi:hypothetical protein